MNAKDIEQETSVNKVPLPIKAIPYLHQVRAFNQALRLFGVDGEQGRGWSGMSKEEALSRGVALLME